MNTITIIIIIFGIGFSIYTFLQKIKNSENGNEKENLGIGKYFIKKEYFFSKSEKMFFDILEKENNGKYLIFSKIRLEDVVSVDKKIDWKDRKGKRGYIKSKHLDFVLLDKNLNKIISVIELDGKSHNGKNQTHSDEVKNEILEATGIKLFRVRVGENFEEKIREILK